MLLKTLDILGISKELNTHTYFNIADKEVAAAKEVIDEKKLAKLKKTLPFFDEDEERNLIINYFHPSGQPVYFIPKGKNKAQRYFRKRWLNPKSDNKYHSPVGSTAQMFFPPQVLSAFAKKEQIETLFITEGEKKAFKGCNDGVMVVGSAGLYGFKSADRKNLHPDLVQVIEECRVKNLVLLHDADAMTVNWQKGKNLSKRPYQFFCSVRDFVKVTKSHPIDVYYSHISTNYDSDGKGLDDLLIAYSAQKKAIVGNALKLKTDKWFQFLDLRKTSTDLLQTYFGVNNDPKNFYQIYKTYIGTNPFVLGNFEYVPQEDGTVVKTENDKPFQFWKTIKFKGETRAVILKAPLVEFYESKGFTNVSIEGNKGKVSYLTVRQDGNVIQEVEDIDIVLGQLMRNKLRNVNEMAWEAWLNSSERNTKPRWLQQALPAVKADILRDKEKVSYLLFKNGPVKITPHDYDIVPYEEVKDKLIWKNHINTNQFSKRIDVRQCVFFQFLMYAITCKKDDDTMYHKLIKHFENGMVSAYEIYNIAKKESEETGIIEPEIEAMQKILAALTTYGYMLTTLRTEDAAYAVQCVDATIETDLRKHEGRRGKSLFAKSLYQWGLREGCSIGNDDFKNTLSYTFADEWIEADAQILHYKDIEHGYGVSLDNFKTKITDGYSIRKKKVGVIDIPFEQSAKIILDSNHALNGEGGSITARWITIEFGDWFNPTNRPDVQFGHTFFRHWDWEEKNRFHNFAAQCVQLHWKVWEDQEKGVGVSEHKGIIPFPAKIHKLRKLLVHCKPFAVDFFDSMIRENTSPDAKSVVQKPLVYLYEGHLDEDNKLPYDFRENNFNEDGTMNEKGQKKKYCVTYNFLMEKCIDRYPQQIVEELSTKNTPTNATASDLLSFKRFRKMLMDWADFNGIVLNPGYYRNRCQKREQSIHKEYLMLYKPKKSL